MLLAIDCENSLITVGCINQDGAVEFVFRIPTDIGETEFGYAAKIKQILALRQIDCSQFSGAILSCVVPPLNDTLIHAAKWMTGLEPLVVGAGIKTGLHLLINDPGTVAADLVSSAVAAKEEYPLPAIIVDMGTATTVTVVDERARFIGGAILPGVGIATEALAQKTSLLPHIDLHPPKNAIAANTVDCMRSGVVYGSAGAVDGVIERLGEELNNIPASVVATGEFAKFITPYCRHTMVLDETLRLRGLKYIWDKNQSKKTV